MQADVLDGHSGVSPIAHFNASDVANLGVKRARIDAFLGNRHLFQKVKCLGQSGGVRADLRFSLGNAGGAFRTCVMNF